MYTSGERRDEKESECGGEAERAKDVNVREHITHECMQNPAAAEHSRWVEGLWVIKLDRRGADKGKGKGERLTMAKSA